MLRINEISVRLGAGEEEIKNSAAKTVGVSASDISFFEIYRESIDSRHKNDIRMIYSVNIEGCFDEERIAASFTKNKAFVCERYAYVPPENRRNSPFRPIIAGFGPAGMFAALILSEAGLRPIVLERGSDVDMRTSEVERFWRTGILNTDSNVQFGEGGAGTFSDGKLTTGIKDERCRFVLETFVRFGAPKQILWSSHPHIGTDKLKPLVKRMREEIIRLGGEVRFRSRLIDIYSSNGYLQGVSYTDENGSVVDIETDTLLLCIGHSARDTFEMLRKNGLKMEKKAFSMGVRIEHPQEMINRALYGKFWNDKRLGAANYKLSNHPPHGRGGYTFCMCPGGTVVCASSEEGGVVVNGMSEFARDGINANSAILVGVEPENVEGDGPLAGIELQRKIERSAFVLCGSSYSALSQRVGDFLGNVPSKSFGSVKPTVTTGAVPGDIRQVLPPFITSEIALAITAFNKSLPGFSLPDAVLTAPESRSSSPVRIVRDEFRQSSVKGIYPCGEGAGYAGGIVSAAVDGIKSAEQVLKDEIDDC
ncbi:MAG: hypothetical protein IJS90_09390 [Clostridia bacterium]|nr:hypothetical protein [Clostridia bacterium]